MAVFMICEQSVFDSNGYDDLDFLVQDFTETDLDGLQITEEISRTRLLAATAFLRSLRAA